MNRIFVDTTPLCALDNPLDQHYENSQKLFQELQKEKVEIVITDYVIDESMTLLISRLKGGYHLALNLLNWVFKDDSLVNIEWVGIERFHSAKTVFKRFNKDKSWSFTDCTSYVVMKELGIKTAFTFDDNFRQMGFEILGK